MKKNVTESEPTSNPNCMDDFDPGSLSLEMARERILATISPVERIETIPLAHSFGRITGQSIVADEAAPAFRNSAMDGFAFRHQDAVQNTDLKIVGTSLAGHPYLAAVEIGQCIRIMTGAMIPDSLDTVVMQENTHHGNELMQILKLPACGENVRDAGSNIALNSELIGAGTRIGPAAIGALASVGVTEVPVRRKLRIGCFSTGDELVGAEAIPAVGQIRDSNGPMLLALLQNPAIEAIDLGIQPDSEAALRQCLNETSTLDMVISSGGVSVGDADFVRLVLESIGSINFWKIAMKPGRPLTHGILNEATQYFGLPGNPVSSMVTFHQFVEPAIRALQGLPSSQQIVLNARITDDVRKLPGRLELQRGILNRSNDGDWTVATTGLQDSHVLTSMVRANCYIVLPLESTGANVGDVVETIPLVNY